MKKPEKWIRIKFWMFDVLSRNQFDWIVYHKNNPIAVNKDPKLDYRMYVFEFEKRNELSREAVLSSDFDKILLEGAAIQIPIIGVRTGRGIDGQLYGFEVPTGVMGSGNYQISWLMNGPQEWQPIINWYHKTVEYLKHRLDD